MWREGNKRTPNRVQKRKDEGGGNDKSGMAERDRQHKKNENGKRIYGEEDRGKKDGRRKRMKGEEE